MLDFRMWSVSLMLLGLLAGCGPSGPTMIPVSGTVTLDGGELPAPAFIYFTSDGESDSLMRPGTASVDIDGSYRAMTFQEGDGLLPGKYVLRVDCWKTPPNMEGKPIVSFIPARYQNPAQSELELVVSPDDKTLRFDVDLKSK